MMCNFDSFVGTEELGHLEIIATIIYQLTCRLSIEEIKASGFDKYYIDHTLGFWPQAAGGVPFNACEFQSKGDPITDLFEDMAAEQKARSTYDNILRLLSFDTFSFQKNNSQNVISSTLTVICYLNLTF